MKKIFCALLPLALIFTSCRYQDNSAKTSMPIGSFDPEPVSQAFDGAEKLQGQNFGIFTMPDVITVPDKYEIYKLTIDRSWQDIDDFREQDAKRLFKKYYGDDYEEEKCKIMDGPASQLIMYFMEDGLPYSEYGDVQALGEVFPFPFIIYNNNTDGNDIISAAFQLKNGEDGEVEVDGKKIKASEIAKNAKEWVDDIEKNVSIGNGFEFEARDVFAYHSMSSNGDYIQVNLAELYKGIAFEEYISPFNVVDSGEDSDTYYAANTLEVVYSDDFEKPTNIRLQGSDRIKESEKLDKIISLEGAVEILKNELAKNIKYDFDKVELMYCCKITQKRIYVDENGDIPEERKKDIQQPLTFTPTWCFFFNNEYSGLSREAVKVDALTGEITLDVV